MTSPEPGGIDVNAELLELVERGDREKALAELAVHGERSFAAPPEGTSRGTGDGPDAPSTAPAERAD